MFTKYFLCQNATLIDDQWPIDVRFDISEVLLWEDPEVFYEDLEVFYWKTLRSSMGRFLCLLGVDPEVFY